MTRRLLTALFGLGLSVAPVAQAQVPRPSPEFVISLPSGQQLLLSQYRGKVVAIEFLLTTCPHCQTCSSLLDKLYKEYSPRGFQPLGVAFNPMAGMLVPDYVKGLQLSFPVGVSERDPVLDYLRHSSSLRMLVPQLVFVDRKGVIRAQHAGDSDFFKDEEKNMRAQIEVLLKEPGPKSPLSSKSKKAPASKPASAGAPQALQ